MGIMIDELGEEAIVHIIEENLYTFFLEITQGSKKDFLVGKDINWVKTTPALWPNFIFHTRFNEYNAKRRVIEVIKEIKDGNAPSEWLIGPGSSPANLQTVLSEKGFSLEYCMTGMAVDLNRIYGSESISGLEIKTVYCIDLLEKWTKILSMGLFDENEMNMCLFKNILGRENIRFYIALFKGLPVASSMLTLFNGVAGIHMISTLPGYRKRGIGTAITIASLLEARNMGYSMGVLQASQMGRDVYKKIGFKEYCRFDVLKTNS